MGDVVEKVAMAICDGMTNGNMTLDGVSEREHHLYMDAARSAIKAYEADGDEEDPYRVYKLAIYFFLAVMLTVEIVLPWWL